MFLERLPLRNLIGQRLFLLIDSKTLSESLQLFGVMLEPSRMAMR
jgi:hypothetical protein